MKMRVYTYKQVHVPVEARSAWFLLRQGLSHFAGSLLRPQTPPLSSTGTEVHNTPVCFQLVFETGSLYVALAVLKLTMKTMLASNSQICLPPPSECWD